MIMSLDVAFSHRFAEFSLDMAFDVPEGITVMFGPSGSGKSTALRVISGLMRPDAGHVALGERALFDSATKTFLPPHKRSIGTIFQDARLFPHLTVRQNLNFGRRYAKTQLSKRDETQIIDMLGIGHLLTRRPEGLSGGEAQRVSIGRTLMAQPEMILADEPLSALDPARKGEILPYFERLRDHARVPILYVTHNPLELARLANRVVVLGQGQVLGQGRAADVLSDPALSPAVGSGALIEARVQTCHPDGLAELAVGSERLFVPSEGMDLHVGQGLRLRIPPHDVMISRHRPEGFSALNIVEGRVCGLRDMNFASVMVCLETGAGRILAQVTRRSLAALDLKDGTPCFAVIKTVAIAHDNLGFSSVQAGH